MPEWKDITTLNDDGDLCWELQLRDPDLRIVVFFLVSFGREWRMECSRLGYDSKPLEATELDTAKAEAMALVEGRLQKLINALQAMHPVGPLVTQEMTCKNCGEWLGGPHRLVCTGRSGS